MNDGEIEQAWDELKERYGVSEETLQIITNINGYSLKTLEDVLHAVTGYQDFEQARKEYKE